MKKLVPLLLAIAFTLVALPCAADSVPLLAGKTIDAGEVTVSDDGENLTVTYTTNDPWVLIETHLYVSKKEPLKSAPGRFPFKGEGSEYIISLEELGAEAGDILYIAAHAELMNPDVIVEEIVDDSGQVIETIYWEETGWAEGDNQIPPSKNWAMYFSYTIPVAGE